MIATEGSRENLLAPDHPMPAITDAIPLGGLGTPDDIASAAVFLASDEAFYVPAPISWSTAAARRRYPDSY